MKPGSSRLGGTLLSIFTLFLAFAMFFPILWMFLTSFKTEQQAIQFPPQLFFTPTFENWRVALFNSPFLEYLQNTVIITFFAILAALVLGVPTAYAMAFYQTKRTDSSLLCSSASSSFEARANCARCRRIESTTQSAASDSTGST